MYANIIVLYYNFKEKTCIFVKYYVENRDISMRECMFMYRFLNILGILLFFHFSSIAQKEVTITWENDTAWYVNPDFDISLAPTYKLKLTTPIGNVDGCTHFKVDWGDGSALSGVFALNQENTIDHVYHTPGLYELKINLYANESATIVSKVVVKKIMNRSLAANFRLEPENSRRCMEWGGDSILVVLSGNDNPPGTRYEIQINSDVEKAGVVVKNAFETKWIGRDHDSAWIVAKEPTGIYGARVGLQVSYKKDIELVVPPMDWKSFFVYKSPDLRDIYHFADTLVDGQPYPYLDACSSEAVHQMWQDSLRLMKYQYRTAFNPVVIPYYNSINNKEAFQVDYFWTENPPDANTEWLQVTTDPEFIDTTRIVRMRKAGYYKIRIIAYNQCGYDLHGDELVRIDSLWTDSLKDSQDKRYFRVYEQAADMLVCLKDSVCGKEVVFVDRNVRHNYDVAPEYVFQITTSEGTGLKRENYSIHSDIYLDGRVINGESGWQTMGCDSTVVTLKIKDFGAYEVELLRKTEACDDIKKNFTVYLGALPESYASLIENKLNADYGVVYDEMKRVYQKCDSFRYYLQNNLWKAHTFDLDSVYFYFKKGNAQLDTILNYEKAFYDFDSVGNWLNKIQVRAHNYCGWKEIGTEFYTRTKPDVVLWRDGRPDNDTLCLNFAYPYEISGKFPEHAMVKYQAKRSMYVDGILQHEHQIKEINNYQGEKISVRSWQLGTTEEGIIVINNDMPTCTQIYKDTLYTVATPDSLIFRDTIRYCETLEEIHTESLFKSGEHSFKQAEWLWNEENMKKEALPSFPYTQDKTDSLYYKLSNSAGCYISGKLYFKPQRAPKLALDDEKLICMPDTLKDYETADYIYDLDKNGAAKLSVYNGWKTASALLCRSGGECNQLALANLPYNELSLIYVLETPVTKGFVDGCYLEDTVRLLLRQPLLEITKEDTLKGGNTYHFSALAGFIDTAYLHHTDFVWTTVTGGNHPVFSGPDRLLDWTYTLGSTDQEKNKLMFELKSVTDCGDELIDTLNVLIPHKKLKGYTKMVCPDEEYLLWPEVESAFIDESTLQWKICYPVNPALQGYLSSVSGPNVTYKHPVGVSSDSIRIYVEGTFSYGTEKIGDTIILKVGTLNTESELLLAHHRDTLCRTENEIEILRSWLTVTPVLYEDSLLLNGQPFLNDLNYQSPVLPGATDTLIFSVNIHGCTKFEGKSVDSLFLYRLPAMITDEFLTSSACETAGMPVGIPENMLHPLTLSHRWIGVGGHVTEEGASVSFLPAKDREGVAAIRLYAQPPHGCEEDSLQKEFPVYKLPEVIFKEDTVCGVAGQVVVVPVDVLTGANRNGIDKIRWFRKGNEHWFAETSGASDLSFQLSEQDVADSFMDVVAQIHPLAPCLSITVYDTVRISFWESPQITMSLDPLEICQGTDFDLSSVLQITNAVDTTWTLVTSNAGNLTANRYNSGEYWGNVVFKVRAGGQHACPAEEKELNTVVLYAPQPSILITESLCQDDSLHFEASTVIGVSPVYSWNFGETEESILGKKVVYLYKQAGDYTVYLTADYNGCLRTTDMNITLYAKPEAIFELPEQVAIGKDIELTSRSQPSDVVCKWTFEDDPVNYNGGVVNHIFGGETGERNVLLEVTTPHGCKDTVSHQTWAVVLPMAEFSIQVDSCSGLVHFSNASVRHKAKINWDFGNGTINTEEWNPTNITYERTYSDTIYYVTLTLSNAAGTATKIQPVKLVSKLKAGAEVLPVTDGCNKSEKEIHVLTNGVADTTRIWWGDGSEEYWTRKQEVILRRHRYNNDGTTVKYYPLVVEVKNKCERDILSPVSVPVYPESVKARVVLDEQYGNECLGEVRGFMNKSFGFTPSGYVCEWQFEREGELLTDQREKVEHIFKQPGTYWVKLSVRDNCNSDTDSVMVNVHGNDSLMFTYEQQVWCTGNEIRLSFVPHGEAAFSNFHWTLPDGTEQSGREITYRPQVAGKYLVSLSAIADGCLSVVRDSLEVHETPIAAIEPVETTGCQPFKLMLKGRNDNQAKALPLWDFRDHTSASTFELSKTFEREGKYNVVFKLTTAEGCIDSVLLPVTVLHTPQAGMALRERLFCTGNGNFEVTAINTHPEETSRYAFGWWKGEDLVSVNPDSAKFSFDYTFGKVGLKLVVTDKNTGCHVEKTDSVVSSRTVKALMQTMPMQEACAGETVIFENISQDTKQVRWDFGDGKAASTAVYEHVFPSAGIYEVSLLVMNDAGCADSVQIPYRVENVPVAAFSWENDRSLTGLPDTLELPDKATGGIRFINESYLPGEESGHLAFRWNFGDQYAVSDEHSPAHVYGTNGNYEVWLYASTPLGCTDSVNGWVYISALKGLYLPNALVPASADEGISRFQPKGVGLTSYRIAIYDQWGTCVWSSDKLVDSCPAEYWDGTFKSQPLPKGLYLWKVNAIFLDGTVWNDVGGYVNLIR